MARYNKFQKLWIARFRWYITRTKQKVHKIDNTSRGSIVEQFARRCVSVVYFS